MKKALVFILIFISAPIIAGLYGALHDQFTYTISPEYFTKFKYQQFGFEPAWFGGHRQTVAVIGFLATWWVGIFIGLFHALVGLIHKDYRTMLINVFKAIVVTQIIAALTGLIGLAFRKLYLANERISQWFPEDLIDRENFIAVGSMHNFSYIGGLIGLIAGIIYQVRLKKNDSSKSRVSEEKR